MRIKYVCGYCNKDYEADSKKTGYEKALECEYRHLGMVAGPAGSAIPTGLADCGCGGENGKALLSPPARL